MNVMFYVEEQIVGEFEVRDQNGNLVQTSWSSFDAKQAERYRVVFENMDELTEGALNSFKLKAIAQDLNNTVGKRLLLILSSIVLISLLIGL